MKKEEFFLSCSRNFSRFLWINSNSLQITVSENITITFTKFFACAKFDLKIPPQHNKFFSFLGLENWK